MSEALSLAKSIAAREGTDYSKILVAWGLLRSGDVPGALAVVERIKDARLSVDVGLLKLDSLLELNKPAEAQLVVESLVEDGEPWVADFARLRVAIYNKDWPTAARLAADTLSGDASSISVSLVARLGFIEHDATLMEAAASHPNAQPRSQMIRVARLLSALAKKDIASIAEARRALEEPEYVHDGFANYALGLAAMRERQWAQASEMFQRSAEQLGPTFYEATARAATCELKRGQPESAIVWADRALALRREGQRAMRAKFGALVRLGRIRAALRTFADWRRAWRDAHPRRGEG